MADLKLNIPGYTVQTAYLEIHKIFLTVKLSHYTTKSFAAHSALGRTYDDLNSLLDSITEKLIGYSGEEPKDLNIGSISSSLPKDLGNSIKLIGERLEEFACSKDYSDIENLAQELSGVGAQLIYLSRFN